MDLNEALNWLQGSRSMAHTVPHDPFETWQVRIAQADAAKTHQAYCIMLAHQKGLVKEEDE